MSGRKPTTPEWQRQREWDDHARRTERRAKWGEWDHEQQLKSERKPEGAYANGQRWK